MCIQIVPKKVFKFLLSIVLILLFANTAGIILKYFLGHDYVFGLINLFDFDTEKNIPTFYSTLALFFSSVLLFFTALVTKKLQAPYPFYWLILAIIFLFLSLDEFISIHEQIVYSMSRIIDSSGMVHPAAWVIPYGIVLIVIVGIYFKFLMSLPPKIRTLFLISGAIFVIGAIGFEIVGGKYDELHGHENVIYALLYTGEELFEMLGIVFFIYSILMYIAMQFPSVEIIFKHK